jgi:hypothetical protein
LKKTLKLALFSPLHIFMLSLLTLSRGKRSSSSANRP